MSQDTVVFGLEEYQNIEISETKGSEPEESHLMPTQDSPSIRAPLDTGSLGYIESETSSSSTRPASYLEGKGFGWLLEVEEEDEEFKPLL